MSQACRKRMVVASSLTWEPRDSFRGFHLQLRDTAPFVKPLHLKHFKKSKSRLGLPFKRDV
jgi:hypothetical protein